MWFNQRGDILTVKGGPLKQVDKFTYLGNSVSSTEYDINTGLTKSWTAFDCLSVIWKSDLTDKIKCSFFQAAVVSILLYRSTTWTLTKRLEKNLDGNYTRMLQAILINTLQSSNYMDTYHPSRKLSKLDEPDMRDEQRLNDLLEPIYSSSVPIQDVAWKTFRERRTIEMDGDGQVDSC